MLNRVILIGRLATDPEIKYLPGEKGTAICDTVIAVERDFGKTDEGKKPVDFVPIVIFGQGAEYTTNYLGKGRLVAIEGRLEIQKWDDKETGAKRSKAVINVSNIKSLEKGKDAEAAPVAVGAEAEGFVSPFD